MNNRLIESYEQHDPMTREQSRIRHEASAQSTFRRRLAPILASVALIGGGGLYVVAEKITDTPDCKGKQTVTATASDTLGQLAHKHIEVTKGYVDFREVDIDVHRIGLISNNSINTPYANSGLIPVENSSSLLPGDQVTMPEYCED